jgi:hypothetical protein
VLLEVSEDILKECVGLTAEGAEVLYTKRPRGQDGRIQCKVVAKGNARTRLKLRRWDDSLI